MKNDPEPESSRSPIPAESAIRIPASSTGARPFSQPSEAAPSIQSAKGPSWRTRVGLDGLNLLLADVQTGVGPFLGIYLADYGWDEERVGVALTVGGVAGILAQTLAGALVDPVRWKHLLVGGSVVVLAVGALLIAFCPSSGPSWAPGR